MDYKCILVTTKERDRIVKLLSRLPRCEVQEIIKTLAGRQPQNGCYLPSSTREEDIA